ncbi:transcriptional regulator, RpiR family [Caldalkalibacillus thermarum TA2.A1]|uniref:MurR/RpiR family transcriptional regulator n=1 Tax=Caldalkalibacillus thermarum (strain TA2.A1) TaxID=986075 RepID=F5L499_CALTT|nr:MurR/RpiR family transcriptional regulator [Caldalkalibacillus thermarum]EGL83840.1 transcriptional regulator, RpiR family [Caldalkalibacillus thermarum TA2.A1]QZT32485.1 MurR/RpiR family transcriptional regulator [Caldalkalibacillus thermarum TA2.A1]
MAQYRKKIQEEFQNLSAGLKKVAKHLLDNPRSFAMQSAVKVAKEIGVSDATVIRFCYALGYSGFSELQQEVREHLMNVPSSLHEFQAEKEKLADNTHFYINVLKQHQGHIHSVISQLREVDLHQAVQRLIETDQILVAGMRSSFALAHWLVFTLNLVRGNARLYQPGSDDLLLLLSQMNERSTYVAISFHRYARETIKLAQILKEKGVFVIGITDSEVAPVTRYADLVVPVSIPVKSTIDAAPSVMAVLNAIIAGITIHDRERFERRKATYEAHQLDSFFQEEHLS